MAERTEALAPAPARPPRDVSAALVRGAFGLAFFLAIATALGFVVLPVIAIFTHVPPDELVRQLGNPVVHDALIVSLKTSLVAQLAIVVFGTPTAYFLATRRFPGRAALVTLVELPIVLPPAVAGIGLLAAFGKLGLLGEQIGGLIALNWVSVVLAVTFVAGPFYVRQAIAAFEAVDESLVSASRTLGAGPVRTFFRVTLPLARGGLAAGEAIALARGLGEFGATIMFAGSLRGSTQTLPLAIFEQLAAIDGFDVALAISALFVVVSLAILLTLKASGLWSRSRSAATAVAVRRSERS